jgi:hypothetical protein
MRDRPALDLFLVSWLILFLELTCIRWFPSHVMFLTFFTNIVLLASFVGMSVGCLIARNPGRQITHTPTWLSVAVVTGVVVELFRTRFVRYVAVGDQSRPDEIFYGTEDTFRHQIDFRAPVEIVAGLFFVLIAAVLVGPGQELGRAFNRVPSRARAYSWNLFGSLVGIATFSACSYLELPPLTWFAAVALGIAYFVFQPQPAPTPERVAADNGNAPADPRPSRVTPVVLLGLTVLVSLWTSGLFEFRPGMTTVWSPYYRIDYFPNNHLINTNLIGHQMIHSREEPALVAYALPYVLQRDVPNAAWPPFRRVLIIGAGSGNDLSRAVQWLPPDAVIDAVEIDPAIQRIGAQHNPDQPYSDPRVRVHLNDGRNFLRSVEPGTYDLVVFALIDSLVLHSGYSNLRLESYLYTDQAFRDVRRAMTPTGVCAVYNFFRQGWLVARLRDELRGAFEVEPVVIASPPGFVSLDSPQDARLGITIFFVGGKAQTDALRAAFAGNAGYWVPADQVIRPDTPSRFVNEIPPAPGAVIRVSEVEETHGTIRPATDDWPFLYVRFPSIPALTWRGIALVLVLSGLIWFGFRGRGMPQQTAEPIDWGAMGRSFFLGAGFMLVETKAVTQMALLFGGTWTVNSVVFGAILLMSLLGNLYSGWVRPRRLELYYLGLFAALTVGLTVQLDTFLGLTRTTQVTLACALVFAPIAFAGVIFATSFGRTSQPDRVFAANVAGALVGGLAENASVILGFQYLLCVAAGFYLLSSVVGNRTLPSAAAEKSV